MTGIMTSVIGLALSLYFWPTQEQIDYCKNAGWSYEVVIINDKPQLTEEAKTKAELCKRILNMKEVNNLLKYE